MRLGKFRDTFFGSGSLKKRAITAGTWVFLGFALSQLLRFSGNLVLTRLLAPDVFGIMAIASVAQLVIAMFTDIGLRPAIMHSPNGENEKFLNTAWTIQVGRGLLVWLLCLVAAAGLQLAQIGGIVPSDSAYADRYLPPVLAALSFASVIMGFQSIKVVSLHRRLDLKPTIYIELIQMVVGLCVAVTLAWLTKSIWAFVVSGLVGPLVTTVLSRYWLPGRRDRFAWDRAAVIEIVRFGRWIFLSSMIGVLALNGDRLLLAGWVTPAMLGYYSIAANLATVIDNTASRIFSAVSLPALSEIGRQQPSRLREVYFRMRRIFDTLFLFTAGFLFATGEGIIDLLFDHRYAPAGEILRWLSFGLLFSRYGLSQNLYAAVGKPNFMAALNLARVISLFVVVPGAYALFGVNGSIVGIALYLLPTVPLIWAFNARLGLNSFKFELVILVAWPIGWLAGETVMSAFRL